MTGSDDVKINEIFTSIQGEGPLTGMKCLFVRTYGCNRNCRFCDTKKHNNVFVELPVDAIVKAIDNAGLRRVVITGGEPTIQLNELKALVHTLTANDYHVSLETNGDIQSYDTTDFDCVVVSPKDLATLKKWVKYTPEFDNTYLKVVVHEHNIDDVMKLVAEYDLQDIYFMPLGTTPLEIIVRSALILNKMNEYNIEGFLSTRMHILYGVR